MTVLLLGWIVVFIYLISALFSQTFPYKFMYVCAIENWCPLIEGTPTRILVIPVFLTVTPIFKTSFEKKTRTKDALNLGLVHT